MALRFFAHSSVKSGALIGRVVGGRTGVRGAGGGVCATCALFCCACDEASMIVPMPIGMMAMKPAVVTRATLSLAWTIILIAPLAMPSAVGVEALAPGAAMQVDINDGGAACVVWASSGIA